MITFHNVDKRYKVRGGYKVILDNASAHLPERNIGVLGANGAGKSTLLRMISGAEKPTSGAIECDRRVSFPLGFAGSFNGSLTGLENALFVSRIYGEDTETVIEYLKEFSQLGDQLYMPVNTYSSGMRARLAFGVSLAIDFEMYLVDEITAVGDARFKERSKAAFKSKLGHATILMVSHGMGTLREYCDAGVVMQDGRLTYYDDLEEAIRHHNRNMGGDTPMKAKPAGAKRPGGGGGGGQGKGQGGPPRGQPGGGQPGRQGHQQSKGGNGPNQRPGPGGRGQGGRGQGGRGQGGRGQGGRGQGGRGQGGRGQGEPGQHGQGGQRQNDAVQHEADATSPNTAPGNQSPDRD